MVAPIEVQLKDKPKRNKFFQRSHHFLRFFMHWYRDLLPRNYTIYGFYILKKILISNTGSETYPSLSPECIHNIYDDPFRKSLNWIYCDKATIPVFPNYIFAHTFGSPRYLNECFSEADYLIFSCNFSILKNSFWIQ